MRKTPFSSRTGLNARIALTAAVFVVGLSTGGIAPAAQPLSGTKPLDWQGDLASRMVDSIDEFLLRETRQSRQRRASHWVDDTPGKTTSQRLAAKRQRLATILGVRDERVPFAAPTLVATTRESSRVARTDIYEIHEVQWPAFGDVQGRGLLLRPRNAEPVAHVIAIPDADVTPEQLAGLTGGVPRESQYARRLAESGCRVLVPLLVNRRKGDYKIDMRKHQLTNREFVYRSAFELGRHLIGYELQQTLALVDWLAREAAQTNTKIGVIGWGEGAHLALYAAALDDRIDAACVSGHFDDRRGLWQQPIDRNVFGLLEQFGDAELAAMIAPRRLIVEAARGVEVTIPPGTGGGPGVLDTPDLENVRAEVVRAGQLADNFYRQRGEPSSARKHAWLKLVESGDGQGMPGSDEALSELLQSLSQGAQLARPNQTPLRDTRPIVDPAVRHARLMHELDRHSQALLAESPHVRRAYFDDLDTSSVAKFHATIEAYRDHFRHEVIGHFDDPLAPPNPRTRLVYDEPGYTGYEVVLDVFDEVFAYGILLVPKGIVVDERRPVVVCQHGLEGRPQHVADPENEQPAYHRYACQLADRGFVVFAPQNPYIFEDRFRSLQRKANPLKKTLFSVIVPQHEQITRWLASLPMVDPERIAFYGLSYGGKTAMRVPALVERYCLSICSADFGNWVWKNVSTRSKYSYVWTGEYEIFEFDLGSTFNYAEMAALIAPRPFMVERGHFDGVSPDEMVAYEFAKVRHLYAAKLGLADRCEIEWFVGPHTINGVGTFAFLHKHLAWPVPGESSRSAK